MNWEKVKISLWIILCCIMLISFVFVIYDIKKEETSTIVELPEIPFKVPYLSLPVDWIIEVLNNETKEEYAREKILISVCQIYIDSISENSVCDEGRDYHNDQVICYCYGPKYQYNDRYIINGEYYSYIIDPYVKQILDRTYVKINIDQNVQQEEDMLKQAFLALNPEYTCEDDYCWK